MEHFVNLLERRRQQLGMSYAALAKRSGVSMPTVKRLLHQRHCGTSFEHVYAVAKTLGVSLDSPPAERIDEILESQARSKATRLTAMLQGTSGLEGQGLDPENLERLQRQTVHELLAGPRRRLWSD